MRINFNDGEASTYKEGWKYKGYKIDNNGTVTKWLPEEYQEVEYIQNNDISGSYILPNIDWNECNGNIKLETTLLSKYPFGNILKIPMKKVTRLFISSWRPYIAIEKEDEKDDTYTTRLWGVVAQTPSTISADFCNGILEAKNDSPSGRETFNTTQSTTTRDIIFFAVKSCLYDAKFYIDNNIVRNYIPCYSITNGIDVNDKECPSGTIGLYDLLEGKFYTNQGNGDDFTKGPDV